MNVLLVEDEPRVADFIDRGLRAESHGVTVARTGGEGVDLAKTGEFDVIILDLMLPDMHGYDVCQRLRQDGEHTPILMLTAMDALEDKIKGIKIGADDYLTKPFELKELHARVRARLRRGGYEQEARGEASGIALGDLLLDPIERRVQRGERNIALSQREFELLLFLVRHADEVLARHTILDVVWGAPFVGDPNTLDVYMGYLRKKVEAQGEPQLLHTVRGVGFMARVGDPKS